MSSGCKGCGADAMSWAWKGCGVLWVKILNSPPDQPTAKPILEQSYSIAYRANIRVLFLAIQLLLKRPKSTSKLTNIWDFEDSSQFKIILLFIHISKVDIYWNNTYLQFYNTHTSLVHSWPCHYSMRHYSMRHYSKYHLVPLSCVPSSHGQSFYHNLNLVDHTNVHSFYIYVPSHNNALP